MNGAELAEFIVCENPTLSYHAISMFSFCTNYSFVGSYGGMFFFFLGNFKEPGNEKYGRRMMY